MNKRMRAIPVVAMALVMVLSVSGCFGGGSAATTVPGQTLTLAQVQAQVEQNAADVISLRNDIDKAATPEMVDAKILVLKQQLESLAVGMTPAQVEALVTPLSDQLNSLSAQIAAMQAEIAVLQAPPATSNPAVVAANIRYIFPSLTYTATFPATSAQSGSFRLDVTNSGGALVKDVQLLVYFLENNPSGVSYNPAPALASAVAVGSTPIMWQYGGMQSGALMFANGLGFDLAAGETKTISLTLTVQSPDTGFVTYTPYVYVTG